MKIHLWGTDFRRSSAELRKKLSIPLEEREARLREVLNLGFKDLVYLWTCNRVEFYTTATDYFCDTRPLWVSLIKKIGLSEDDYYRGYHFEGKSALRHLMRVASSLESMVVGEPQILGQLKEAIHWNNENKFPLDKHMERSFELSFEAAKRVRTETAIAEKPVSVGTLGLKYLQSMEAELPLTKIALVGRSPIILSMLQWLKENRPETPILWVNRNIETLKQYPESEGVELSLLSHFIQNPPSFSHLLTATSSIEPIFTESFFERVEPTAKAVFDLAQPADVVETPFAHIRYVKMENLLEEARANTLERANSVLIAEKLIESMLKDYFLEQKEKPLIRDFNTIEPTFLKELESVIQIIEKEFPLELQAKAIKIAEKLVKKNLHISREHLREILKRVTALEEVSHSEVAV